MLRIDCDALTIDQVPFPEDAEIVVIHSGEHRELSGSAYAERRAECEAAEQVVGRLRDASPVDVEAIEDPVRRRARHVTTENRRVDALASALAKDQLAYAGELLVASHASLRDDFEVSTPVLDQIVGACGACRVYGARVGAGLRRLRGGPVPAQDPDQRAGRLARPPPPAPLQVKAGDAARHPGPPGAVQPHQNRSWPSTSTTGPRRRAAGRGARRTGTARWGEHHVGLPGGTSSSVTVG